MLRSVQPFQKPSSFDRKKVDFHRIRSYQITDADLSWNRRTIYAFSSDANSMELVDRCNTRRKDESFLNHCLTNPNSRMVLFDDDLKPLVLTSAQKRGPVTVAWQPLALLKLDELKDAIPMKLNAIPKGLMLLGIKNDIPYFAIDTTQWPQFQVKQENSAKFLNLRAIAGDLNRSEGAMLAHAKTVLDWQRTHSFCSNCGKENRVAGMGTAFHCDSCKKEHHPRSDPAMIVLVSKGDRCLLGRQAVWEKGRYSTLAGFIEPGETIEDAVRREVWEESGIQVGQVAYEGSQPWPFPRSFMIGCLATATSDEVKVNLDEMDDARWFERSEVLKALDGTSTMLSLPPSFAISSHLIRKWATQT